MWRFMLDRGGAEHGGGWRRRLPLVAGLLLLPAVAVQGESNHGNGHAPTLPVIEVWKRNRTMELREGQQVVRQFQVELGYNPDYAKRIQGDSKTPVGQYYVCDKRPESRFHRFLGISYPNIDDAERAYAERLISAREWADIFLPILRRGIPSWRTALGGRIGIHGHGGRTRDGDWTLGCIAVSDEEIEFLYERVPVGTPVIINE